MLRRTKHIVENKEVLKTYDFMLILPKPITQSTFLSMLFKRNLLFQENSEYPHNFIQY